jgi:hypothetical protein
MDLEHETARLKWLLIGLLVFVVSAFFSWRELKYAAVGKAVDAKLLRVYESTESGRRGRTTQKLAVEYWFADGGADRKETDTLSIDATPPAGPAVAVQYLAGTPGSSRLAGNGQRVWVLVFFASLAFVGFKVFQVVREGRR